MTLGLSAAVFIIIVTVTLIIVTNKKFSKKIRITVGILGGIIAFLSAIYIMLALILFGAV
jgi:cytochrome bd-type quinol oxidase subunit 1